MSSLKKPTSQTASDLSNLKQRIRVRGERKQSKHKDSRSLFDIIDNTSNPLTVGHQIHHQLGIRNVGASYTRVTVFFTFIRVHTGHHI